MCPVIPVSLLRLSSISVSWRKRSEADSPSCHLTGATFDVRMAADPLVVSVTGEAVQPSGLEKQEPLKGEMQLPFEVKLFPKWGYLFRCLTRSWQGDLASLLLCQSELLWQDSEPVYLYNWTKEVQDKTSFWFWGKGLDSRTHRDMLFWWSMSF